MRYGEPKGRTVTIRDLRLKSGAEVTVLGSAGIRARAAWRQVGADVVITFPVGLAGKYAYGLKIVRGVE